ncbi:MAG: hypothetical protein ACK47B_00585 [Armatimonadota bacterium]
MRRLVPFVTALTALLLCGSLTAVAGAAPKGRRTGVTVTAKTLKPGKVPGDGRELLVRVKVNASGVTVDQVEGQVSLPGIAGPTAALQPSGRFFQGTLRVPVNSSRRTVKGFVYVYVTTAENGVPVQRRVGTIKVLPWNDSSPPPPPSN